MKSTQVAMFTTQLFSLIQVRTRGIAALPEEELLGAESVHR